jgi:hypothetical protein
MHSIRTASVVVGFLLAGYASGAPPPSHSDLTPLAFFSDVVVVADYRGGTEDDSEYIVRRVLAGSGVTQDEALTIDEGSYRSQDISGREDAPRDAWTVLFLRRRDPNAIELDRKPAKPWRLVGLRVSLAGKVYRFVQQNGPYYATPQGHDPDDVLTHTCAGHLSTAQFERELEPVFARAEALRKAFAAKPKNLLAALVPLLPPPEAPIHGNAERYYSDDIAGYAFNAMANAHDVEGALEVLSRAQGPLPWGSRWRKLPEAELVAAAKDKRVPAHRRAAAVQRLTIDSKGIEVLLELATDPDVRVRAAAITSLGYVTGSKWETAYASAIKVLISALVPTERAPSVRIALFKSARNWSFDLGPIADPYVFACVRESSHLTCNFGYAPGAWAQVEIAELVSVDSAGAEHRCAHAPDGPWHYTYSCPVDSRHLELRGFAANEDRKVPLKAVIDD